MSFNLHPTLKADSFIIGDFELCQLLLLNDYQYPWFVLVPKRADIKEIYQLSDTDQKQFWFESRVLSEVVMQHFEGDKLNVAAIGNMVPQLHIHHIVRFESDACWPKPVWGQKPMLAYENSIAEEVVRNISHKLKDYGFKSM